MTGNLSKILQQKEERKAGSIWTGQKQILEHVDTTGAAAFVSVENLHKTSKLPRKQAETFLEEKDAHKKSGNQTKIPSSEGQCIRCP